MNIDKTDLCGFCRCDCCHSCANAVSVTVVRGSMGPRGATAQVS